MYCNKKNHEQLTPLISAYCADKIIAWREGETVSQEDFLADVFFVAKHLPGNKYIFNLCEDRYLFLVTFAAVIVNGQINMLPPNNKSHEISDIAIEYTDCCYVAEAPCGNLSLDKSIIKLPHQAGPGVSRQPPLIDKQSLVAIIFTSGSTGHAKKNFKTWNELVEGIRTFQFNMGIDASKNYAVVATVPPQHMYGLEMSILLPLIGGVSVSASRPFYPEDIQKIVDILPKPVILVTTPLQLKACAYSGVQWPAIEFVVCSTAPLSAELADHAEQVMHTRVMEIYGSTETGAIATRRTASEDDWNLFNGYRIDHRAGLFSAEHIPEPVELNDHVLMLGHDKFRLMGRKTDMIKIAGKRGSLGDLNNKLRSIEGVDDGVFLYPQDNNEITGRLVALVVAPGMAEKKILNSLAELIDPVFLPRPLVLVEALPYTEMYKLRRSDLLALYKKARKK